MTGDEEFEDSKAGNPANVPFLAIDYDECYAVRLLNTAAEGEWCIEGLYDLVYTVSPRKENSFITQYVTKTWVTLLYIYDHSYATAQFALISDELTRRKRELQ